MTTITAARLNAFKARCRQLTLIYPKCPGGCSGNRLHHHEWCIRKVILSGFEELYRVEIEVMRWKCSCTRSFRNLPEGILPHSRYALVTMVPCLLAVLKGESYVEASVAVEASPLVSEEEEGFSPSPSTVYRWVDKLAGLSRYIQDRLGGVLASLERVIEIPLPRCRSEGRKGVWGLAIRVLLALGRIPPDFAMPLSVR